MRASFLKRMLAFFTDYLIISIVLSIITTGFNIDSKKYNDELNDIMNNFKNEEINAEQYTEQILALEYDLQKTNLPVNGVSCVLFVGYFVIFGYLNKGQTLGKKLFNIKVVNKNGDRVGLWNMVLRSLFIYGILSTLYSVICVLFFNVDVFGFGYKIISAIESVFLFVSFFMIMYKKDGKGLHDLIAGTYVEEVK